MLQRLCLCLLALAILSTPAVVDAAGGSGGGGSGGGGGGGGIQTNARVTGYITAIDYVNYRVSIGQSYYGSGVLTGSSDTKISINTVNATFNDLQVGDWAEARYDLASRFVAKISVTR